MRRLPRVGYARTHFGYQEATFYPCLGIVEGAPNVLAIIAHAWASGAEEHVGPICMPSTSANFSESDLAYLQGKRARIFIDDDGPGKKAAKRWAAQLEQADIEVDGFCFAGLVKTGGQPVKDLNNLCEIDYDSWQEHYEQVESVMNFVFERNI